MSPKRIYGFISVEDKNVEFTEKELYGEGQSQAEFVEMSRRIDDMGNMVIKILEDNISSYEDDGYQFEMFDWSNVGDNFGIEVMISFYSDYDNLEMLNLLFNQKKKDNYIINLNLKIE